MYFGGGVYASQINSPLGIYSYLIIYKQLSI